MILLLIGIAIGMLLMYAGMKASDFINALLHTVDNYAKIVDQLVAAHNERCDKEGGDDTDAVSNVSPYSPSPERPVGFHIN